MEVGSKRNWKQVKSDEFGSGVMKKLVENGGGGAEFWNPEVVLTTVEMMLEHGLHSDLTFVCEGERISAHRCILASVSPVFRAMFENQMLEQTTSIVNVDDMSPDPFRCFIRYLYSGKISRAEIEDHGLEVLAACQKYQVPHLAKVCSQVLADLLTVGNCLGLLDHAWLYDASLLEKCKEFIALNWTDVVATQGFEVLTQKNPSLSVELVRDITSSDKIRELKVTFRPFSTISSICTFILKMSVESTIADVIAKTKEMVKLPSNKWLQMSGVVDHRIVKVYDVKEKVKDVQYELKAEEVQPHKAKSSARTVRIAHALLTGSEETVYVTYFGEPFTVRIPHEDYKLRHLKEMLFCPSLNMDSDTFEYLRRSNLDPHSNRLEYLDHRSRVPCNEDEFIALVHPICTCSADDLHSPLLHIT